MKFDRWNQLLESLEYPLVFVDTETTSSKPERAALLEAACLYYGPPRLFDGIAYATGELAPGLHHRWRSCYKPEHEVLESGEYRRSVKIHRYDEKTVRGWKPWSEERGQQFADCLTQGYVVGFNSEHYDMRVIERHLSSVGIELDAQTRQSIDVWRLLARVCETCKRPTGVCSHDAPLSLMADGAAAFKRKLGIAHEALLGVAPDKSEQHGATYDCVLTANVLAALLECYPDQLEPSIDQLIWASNTPPRNWPDWEHFIHYEEETGEWVFQRGENQGLALHEVRRSYLDWMLTKGTFELATRYVIRSFMYGRGHLHPIGLFKARERWHLADDYRERELERGRR